MNDFTLQPLGPEAIRARMEQIRAQYVKPTASAVGGDFSGLTGSITSDGTKPYDPFGGQSGLRGKGPNAELRSKIVAAAQANGLDPDLLDAIVSAESDYDPTCVSKVGARGLTQLMPQTAVDMGVTNPFDPDQSLEGGAKYLAGLMRKFPQIEHAVAAYNAGPGAVIRAGGIPNYPETRGYVQKVMALYREHKN